LISPKDRGSLARKPSRSGILYSRSSDLIPTAWIRSLSRRGTRGSRPLDLDPTLRTPSSHRSNTARWIRNGRLRFKTRANRYGEVPSAGSRSYGSDLNNTRSNLAHSLQIERSGVFGCRGRRCYCSGDAFRGGASPALAKSILRGPIQAGPEPKRTRGTRRALLGAQRG
jgi:hypothetical protein